MSTKTFTIVGGSIDTAGNWSPSGVPGSSDTGVIHNLTAAATHTGVTATGFQLDLAAARLEISQAFALGAFNQVADGGVLALLSSYPGLAMTLDASGGTGLLALYADATPPQLLLPRDAYFNLTNGAALYFGLDRNGGPKALGPVVRNADLIILDATSVIEYAAPTVFLWDGYLQPEQVQFDLEIALPHVGLGRAFQWRVSVTDSEGFSTTPNWLHVVPYRAAGVETNTPITLTPDAIDPTTFMFSFTPSTDHWAAGDQGQIYVVFGLYDGTVKRVKYGFTVDNLAADVMAALPADYQQRGVAVTLPDPPPAPYAVPTAAQNASAVWGATTRTLTDLSGAKLAADGLDAVPTTAAAGVAATFREMLVQLWRRFFRRTVLDRSAGTITTFADDGTSVLTTQDIGESATSQTQGAAR